MVCASQGLILTSLVFSTKAGTLLSVRDSLSSARIAPIHRFAVSEWRADQAACLHTVQGSVGDGPYIVRSSSNSEDTSNGSNAGAYLTVLDVSKEELSGAIERVISSYGPATEHDEVLVQPMLSGVVRSGVAFSHDAHTGSPYRVITWTEGTDTTIVTGGRGGRTWQAAARSPVEPPADLAPVVALLDELLTLFDGTPIDCEFAVTGNSNEAGGGEVLWLLQVRPLVIPMNDVTPETQAKRLELIADKVDRGNRAHPFLMGQRTVYGVMPDWNPAEMIGVRPKPFALSLYRELVTDSIWAYQRHNYGYRNLRSFPLMPHFFGLPYIDVRVSFNSFIPADLDDGLASRLVDHYIERLLAAPELHDKVEFEIVYSCYTFDLPERLERLADAGFSRRERDAITESLRSLTHRIVDPQNGLWRQDAAKIDVLSTRREDLFNSAADPIERIYWLLEDAKRYGTLPFAGLARAGFIAVQMLRSLVTVGTLSEADYDAFMSSISTVSRQMNRDRSILDKSTFLSRYGHLRPGTYDILSPRYDEAPELYFDWDQRPTERQEPEPFSMTLLQMREVTRLLTEHGLQTDNVELFDFLQAGIELREFAKFQFTRNLSDALSLSANVADQWGITREDMAYCDVAVLRELHVAATDPGQMMSDSIAAGKKRYKETLGIALPPVITSPDDVWAFEWPESAPNFITQKQVTATVRGSGERDQLDGVIVCIPNADPGFDWLFSYPIAGLITAWGGANSHMAIRAGEQSLPAVIGVGEAAYRRWSSAQRLHLDCAGRRVEVLA